MEILSKRRRIKLMAKNYIIRTSDNDNILYFSGWDAILGGARKNTDKGLAFRMLRTIAEKDLPKIEKLWNRHCKIESV